MSDNIYAAARENGHRILDLPAAIQELKEDNKEITDEEAIDWIVEEHAGFGIDDDLYYRNYSIHGLFVVAEQVYNGTPNWVVLIIGGGTAEPYDDYQSREEAIAGAEALTKEFLGE